MSNDSKEINLPDNQPITTEPKKNTAVKIIEALSDKVAPTRHVPLNERLAELSAEQKLQLQSIEDQAITNFCGMLDELESALGMLRIGHHVGWKVLYLAHSKKTIRKYEDILSIRIRDLFPEKGPSAQRSIGLALAEKISNFWKVVSGEIKIENRREIL